MLCPNCGTEVGDQLGLCSRCAASGASRAGASLGSIRPTLKVVHLKPGQTAEDFVQPSSREGFASTVPEPEYRPETSSRRISVVTGVILVFGAVVALLYLFVLQGGQKSIFEQEPKHAGSDFSHIVIHEKKEINIDGSTVFGIYRINDREVALGKPRAVFSKAKNTLEIHFPFSGEQASPETANSALKVWMQFSKLEGKIERDKLQSYMIEFSAEKGVQRLVRTYSRHLAEFAEVSLISVGIRNGESIRGSLQSAQTVENSPSNLEVSWQLTFDAPLEIEK